MTKLPTKPGSIDDYIASCAAEVRPILVRIRDTIRKAAPAAEERISYQIPAFFQDGPLVYFAAFKKHIGFYPPVRDEALKPQLAKYAGEKGNLQFPLDEPIPYALITKIVKARLKENREAAKSPKASAKSPDGRSSARKPAKSAAKRDIAKGTKGPARAKQKPAAAKPKGRADTGKESAATKREAPKKAAKPKLLSGGNPQIAKGYGDEPVQAYIAAMPGWKRDVGRRLDALITRTVPGVHKAVKWNSPFYGVEDDLWFLSFHCFTKYIKVTFFRGTSLHPVPPFASKHKDVRYFHVHEDDAIDVAQFAAWVKQARQLPGERM